MILPTRKVIFDLVGLAMLVLLVVVVRPGVGDRMPFGSAQHSILTVIAYYALSASLAIVIICDLVTAVRNGTALRLGRRVKRRIELVPAKNVCIADVSLGAAEALLYSAQCLSAGSELVAFRVMIEPKQRSSVAGGVAEEERRDHEIAWRAERLQDARLAPRAPGEYRFVTRLLHDMTPPAVFEFSWCKVRSGSSTISAAAAVPGGPSAAQ